MLQNIYTNLRTLHRQSSESQYLRIAYCKWNNPWNRDLAVNHDLIFRYNSGDASINLQLVSSHRNASTVSLISASDSDIVTWLCTNSVEKHSKTKTVHIMKTHSSTTRSPSASESFPRYLYYKTNFLKGYWI